MAYLTTILTYHIPSEAEVDKSLLEAHGITVNLLNANVSRNELGAPFHIRLQVPDAQVAEAVALLKEMQPSRFGSEERVNEIERGILRALRTIPLYMLVAATVLFFAIGHERPIRDRLGVSAVNGSAIGALTWAAVAAIKGRRKS